MAVMPRRKTMPVGQEERKAWMKPKNPQQVGSRGWFQGGGVGDRK
jgi:hypothetical protein